MAGAILTTMVEVVMPIIMVIQAMLELSIVVAAAIIPILEVEALLLATHNVVAA